MLSSADLTLSKYSPTYMEFPIVAVVQGGRLRWYVTDSIIWHLDADSVHGITESDGFRWGMDTVDVHNFPTLLSHLEEWETTTHALTDYVKVWAGLFDLYPDDAENLAWDIFPHLYINSDERLLCVFFDEYIYSDVFCRAAPGGWRSLVHSRLDLIPETDRYWIIGGGDILKKYLFDWSEASCYYDSHNK